MGGTLNSDGDNVGGRLSPLLTFLIVLSIQALDVFLDYLKKRGSNNNEQSQLRQEIKQLLREASTLSTPSTFAQAAKLRRVAAAKEKELSNKQAEQNKDSKLSHDMYERALLVFKVLFYIGFCCHYWSTPVATVPRQLLQPFGRFLSWGARDSVTGHLMVGVIPWLVLTSRVSKFLCQKVSKVIAPK